MVQLPVIGWFTQIGVTTGVMQQVFHVQFEPALACGAMLLIVTFMCVIPIGLIWARVEHVSLKKISEQSEHFGQEDAGADPRRQRSLTSRPAAEAPARSANSGALCFAPQRTMET